MPSAAASFVQNSSNTPTRCTRLGRRDCTRAVGLSGLQKLGKEVICKTQHSTREERKMSRG